MIFRSFCRTWLTRWQVKGIRNADFPTKLRLRYFAEESLTLEVIHKKEDEWTKCFEVTGVKLPQVTYLGLTAETGELSDNFDIIKLETRNLYSTSGSNKASDGKSGAKKSDRKSRGNSGAKPQHRSSSGGSWSWLFLKFVLFGIVVAGAYVAFTMWRAHKRDRF